MLWLACFGLIIGGCASDGNVKSSSDGMSSMVDGQPAESSQTMSAAAAPEPTATTPAMSSAAPAEPKPMDQSKKNRLAAGIDEETLDTCLARIPQDATAGQRMLAEQTCQRDFARRR
jgi:hypothetical protein